MTTIAVCSGKGGAGKTVFSSALATMLAERGRKVLLVDADYSVAGLTYLTRMNESTRVRLTLKNLVPGPVDVSQLAPLFDEQDVVIIPARTQTISELDNDNDALRLPIDNILKGCRQFLLAVASLQRVDYVIVDTRAGLDKFSAAVALSSDYVIVMMEQDRVSWRSSHSFISNALALQERVDEISDRVRTADDFYLLPNKVSPAYSQVLRMMADQVLGNVLPGIPLDLNFFNRYFRNIFGYGPSGRSWRRTAFYRHMRNSMAGMLPDVSGVRYSFLSELFDSMALTFFLWSPRVTAVMFGLAVYIFATLYVLLNLP